MKKDGGQCRYLWGSGKPSPQPGVSERMMIMMIIMMVKKKMKVVLILTKVPEGGIGCHSCGRVPLKTAPDEVGEERILAPWPRKYLKNIKIFKTQAGRSLAGWYDGPSMVMLITKCFHLWGRSEVPASLEVPLVFPSLTWEEDVWLGFGPKLANCDFYSNKR